MTSKTRFIQTFALATISAFGLAACGSTENDQDASIFEENDNLAEQAPQSGDGEVFDFTSQAVRAMPGAGVKEMTFQIHEPLLERDQNYAQYRALDAVVVRATDPTPDSNHDCAIELEYHLTDAMVEAVDNYQWEQHYELDTAQQEATARDAGTVDGVRTLDQTQVYDELGVRQVEGEDEDGEEILKSDIVDDGVAVVHVEQDCAAAPREEPSTGLEFRYLDQTPNEQGKLQQGRVQTAQDSDEYRRFTGTVASAEVNVMANGDLHITEYEIDNWHQDTNGDWISK